MIKCLVLRDYSFHKMLSFSTLESVIAYRLGITDANNEDCCGPPMIVVTKDDYEDYLPLNEYDCSEIRKLVAEYLG